MRVRSDLYNGAPDPNTLYLTDGFFWGDRTLLPFIPLAGHGFRAPEVELLHIDRAWREWPFVAARTQAVPEVAYAAVPCDRAVAAGFNDPTLSAAGVPLAPTLPGDGLSFERFILAAPGPGLAPAVDEALRVRTLVHGDPAAVTVTGRVVTSAGPLDGRGGRAASLLFYEPAPGADPDDETRRTPRTEAVPGPDGRFQVTLPPEPRSTVCSPTPSAGPRPRRARSPSAPTTSTSATSRSRGAGHLVATVEDRPGERATFAELVLVPVDPPAATATPPSLYGLFAGCDPMLGPPHGGSPACNRALATDGRFDLLVPPGRYYVYATRGPFASLDRREIELGAGEEAAISLLTETLPDLRARGHALGRLPRPRRRELRLVDPRPGSRRELPRRGRRRHRRDRSRRRHELRRHARGAGRDRPARRHPRRRADAQHPVVRRAGRDLPEDDRSFQLLAAHEGRAGAAQRRPWDELREPGQMMDDMEPFTSWAPASAR